MLSFLAFFGVTCLLVAEGYLFARLLTGGTLLRLSLALPLVAISNLLLLFACTVLDVPLSLPVLLGSHVVLVALAAWLGRKRTPTAETETTNGTSVSLGLRIACIVLLLCTTGYSFAHAVILPSFQADSFTNWTMRSKLSFLDKRMAFDATEERGVAKPQYPFLFHALQITANQGQREWSDRGANTILWLLNMSCFAAIFLLLKRMMGGRPSLLAITLLTGIPLVTLHFGGGYADIHVTGFTLLSATAFLVAKMKQDFRLFALSGAMAVAAVWTKSEGLFLCLLPWLALA